MITRPPSERPKEWKTLEAACKHRWLLPFLAFEWAMQWTAYGLSRWSLLEVLEYLGAFSVLVAVILYFSESGARVKQRHYQAWQVINTAQGKGGSGGRIEALQELNADKVPLVGVDVSSAFLQGVRLEHADLLRSDFSAADLRGSDFAFANFTYANLHSANLRGSSLRNVTFTNADMSDADFVGSDMTGANLSQTDLDNADLRRVELKNVEWQHIKSIKNANVADLKDAPDGFLPWAMKNGAVENPHPQD